MFLSVCLGLINIRTAKPIVPNFFVATHMTQGWLLASKLERFVDIYEF